MQEFKDKIASLGIDASRVYNADVTGLLYNKMSNKIYLPSNITAKGRKEMASKDRLTVMLCANETGTHKMPLFYIGTAASPHCLRCDVAARQHNVVYGSQASAWMDSLTCSQWFGKVFLPAIKATHGDQRVLFFWDNAPSHMRELAKDTQVTILFLTYDLP
jgi:hypothetical protein